MGHPAAAAMQGDDGDAGGGRFGFGDWSDREFRDRFVSIISEEGRKNNTYKFAWARFLLDHACDPCMMPRMYGSIWDRTVAKAAGTTAGGDGGRDSVTYAEIALYFFAYYWPLACKARLEQGPANQKPRVVQAIEEEFGGGAYPQSVCQIISEEPERVERCLKRIAKVGFGQVVYRFQKVDGRLDPMFYQYAAGPADKEGNRRIDLRGGILVNDRAARFFRENYGALDRAVSLEWLLATDSLNPGAPDLAGRFARAYGSCGGACRFLPGLEAAGRLCFYCGASPGPDERMCVDHFLPDDYVGGTERWNLVLACRKCGREKARKLPPPGCIGKLARRNARKGARAGAAAPPGRAARIERDLVRQYDDAKRRGYPVAASLPPACP